MPVITTYICDKCELEQDTRDGMFDVGITLKSQNNRLLQAPILQALWCRKCTEAAQLGHFLKIQLSKEKETEPLPATLEDMVRDIVDECVGDAMANAD